MVQRFIEGGYGTSEMEEDAQGEWVAYEDYAALKTLTDKLVKLRRGGTVTPEVMCAINKLVDEYKYDN